MVIRFYIHNFGLAVRTGNIQYFDEILTQHGEIFKADETQSLIVRLRQNVIRTAIRQISLAYSKIYIKDIAKKLQVNNFNDKDIFFV